MTKIDRAYLHNKAKTFFNENRLCWVLRNGKDQSDPTHILATQTSPGAPATELWACQASSIEKGTEITRFKISAENPLDPNTLTAVVAFLLLAPYETLATSENTPFFLEDDHEAKESFLHFNYPQRELQNNPHGAFANLLLSLPKNPWTQTSPA